MLEQIKLSSTRRKRKTLNTDEENEAAENMTVDMENQNSNGFEANSGNTKNVEKMQNTHKRSKGLTKATKELSTKEASSSKDLDSEVTKNKVAATFEEDNDIVEMDVEGEITSEGELPSDADESEVDEPENENDGDTSGYSVHHHQTGSEYSDNQQSEVESDVSQYSTSQRKKKKSRDKQRQNMEQKLDNLTNALSVMQQMMIQKGFLEDNDEKETDLPSKKVKSKVVKINTDGQEEKGKNHSNDSDSNSDTTVYKNAVANATKQTDKVNRVAVDVDSEITFNIAKQTVHGEPKHDSTSSEDRIDMSDEMLEPDINDQFIAECQVQAMKMQQEQQRQLQDQGERVIRNAEASKARLFATQGNLINVPNLTQTVSVDDNYMVIGGHVDSLVQHKIINHEYIDFARLLLKGNKSSSWDDNCMELVNKGGMTYFVPVADREMALGGITNFNKWEQAFHVFSNVYTRAYPSHSSELIQYNHIIFTAVNMYVWDNVYTYDKEFHIHLSKFPQRSWSIILQQAWSMCLKDKISRDEFRASGQNSRPKSKEICR